MQGHHDLGFDSPEEHGYCSPEPQDPFTLGAAEEGDLMEEGRELGRVVPRIVDGGHEGPAGAQPMPRLADRGAPHDEVLAALLAMTTPTSGPLPSMGFSHCNPMGSGETLPTRTCQ